jgi:DNA-binding CsgD family transcriptional regulator
MTQEHDATHESPLADLLSPEAALLYTRIAVHRGLRTGTGPDELDMDCRAAQELADAALLWRDPGPHNIMRVVSLTTALRLLLSRQQQDIVDSHERIMRGWAALDAQLKPHADLGLAGVLPTGDLLEVVEDHSTIVALSADFHSSAREELCATSTGYFSTPLVEHQLVTPPKSALAGGARYRYIYDGAFASSPAGARIIELSQEAGEESRIRPTLPTKMLLVDRKVALVALTGTGVGGTAIVRSPQLVGLLHEWFNLLWDDPATATVDRAPQSALNQSQRHVIRLLASGMTDDAIARASDMSVRTVRRHVTSIMKLLGTHTRFATGVAASKRGWV